MVGNIPEAAAEVTGTFEAGLYNGRLDKHGTIQVYKVAGEDDVPYLDVETYLSGLYYDGISFEYDGDKLIATRNNTKVIFDTATNIISCAAWDEFFGSYGYKALPNGILGMDEFNAKAVSTEHESTKTKEQEFGIDLASYGLSMEVDNSHVLLPVAVLQNIFAVQYNAGRFSFNGSDFYNVGSTYNFIYGDYIDPNIRCILSS